MNYALKGHAMKRGTTMVLKRILMAVLAASGVVCTAVFGQTTGPADPDGGDGHTHSVEIPAPADFATLAECIRGQTDPMLTDELEGAHGTVVETTFSILTVAPCSDIMRGSGRNAVTITSLSDLIAAARTKASDELGTDFSDDDFDDMVATLKSNYGGDVLDRVIDEYIADTRADAARSTYNDRLLDLNGDEDGTPTYADATTNYNGIEFDADGDLENALGINIDGVVKVDSILADSDATNLTLPTVSKNARGMVTEDSALSAVSIGEEDSYNITYANVGALSNDITELTNARKDYVALQGSGAPLTRSERRNLEGLIEAIDDALPLLEAKRDAVLALERTSGNTAINAAVTNVETFNNANNRMDGLRRTLNLRIEDLDDAKQALYDAIADPGTHLQQLVTSTNRDDDASQGAKDSIAALKSDYDEAAAEGTTSGTLLEALIAQKNTGGALISAVQDLQSPDDMDDGGSEAVAALTAMDDPETPEDESGPITKNTNDITDLDGRVADNESDIVQIQTELYGTMSGQHADSCPPGDGLIGKADCALARSEHNETDIADVNDKLALKKEYIDNLGAAIGLDAATDEGTVMLADGTMGTRIDKNAEDIVAGDNAVRGEFAMADDVVRGEFAMADDVVRGEFAMADDVVRGEFAMADDVVRGEFAMADDVVRGEFAMADDVVRGEFAMADSMLRSNLTGMIGSNTTSINNNRMAIDGLQDQLEIVRAGVAASMALAGMPAINGRGIAIGVGSYDGESAFAVGFQIQGEQASFKIGVTSSGGETGASAGVGFNF